MTQQTEAWIRLSCFFCVLIALIIAERLFPRRPSTVPALPRRATHLVLIAANTIATRLLIPTTAVAFAMLAQSREWGLLHQVSFPDWLEIGMSVLVFDLAIYFQHVMFHKVPALWRLHLVHHADLDFDATTGLRFHTLEILLSALLKLAVVILLGPPAVAVVIFEVLLNATSMFNHSNLRLPRAVDRRLRWLLVTPDMHRVHHSVIREESDSNFGFNLPWWDRLFRTYRDQPKLGHDEMTIGIASLRDERQVDRLPGMLLLPFQWHSRDSQNFD